MLLLLLATTLVCVQAQTPVSEAESDLEYVEKLIVARREYQKSLEYLRAYYLKAGKLDKAKWAEDELLAFHRTPKRAFRLELEIPPSMLKGTENKPGANDLYQRAMNYKGKGWGTSYIDNQRRAEILLQQILSTYPSCNRISDVAYQLGTIYENTPYQHYERAAVYYERCFQWNPATQHDARLRAARLYDKKLNNRDKAIEIYRTVLTHETDQGRKREAAGRIKSLSGQ